MSWLDVAQAWADQCAEDAAAGRKLAPGSKVRVLGVARREPKFLIGKVGRVEFYYMTGALGQVSFEDKVSSEYTWNPSGDIRVQTKFAVTNWEPVPEDTPLSPEEHRKLKFEWGCAICWGVQSLTDNHATEAKAQIAAGWVPNPCPRHLDAPMRWITPQEDWHGRLLEDGLPLAHDRGRRA